MPNNKKSITVDELRHAEYYEMQKTFDELYAKSQKGEVFDSLMEIILSRNNILLAYRNMKENKGSQTPGTDKRTIKDIGKLSPEEVVEKVRYFVIGSQHGYRPKPVRRKEIPKPNGTTRPLGIPCVWDRLIQQCIKQVLEPICEAKFSDNSYGFRPNRSAEHAIAETHRLMQRSHLKYVVEFDIKSFFDNVNHPKLMKQIWAMGIHDKTLLYIIKRILKAPIRMQNGETIYPTKGTPQGGIISPLLANIVLNELDQWIDSQWINHPVIDNYSLRKNKAGKVIKSNAYTAMRRTRLKEVYIIRYADDFRIFCRTYEQAVRSKIAITGWLKERLKLDIAEEKTCIKNARNKYVEFLGFKLKLYERRKQYVVKSHVCDKKLQNIKQSLTKGMKNIAIAPNKEMETNNVRKYNSKVLGLQNYFSIATDICKDFRVVQRKIDAIMASQFKTNQKRRSKIAKKGRKLTELEYKRYGESKSLKYLKSNGEPIYPIAYVKPQPPISKKSKVCSYTAEGRKGLHDNLTINMSIMRMLMERRNYDASIEFSDNKLSLYSAQQGKCAITQRVFQTTEDIHCHHKIARQQGGNDAYANLVLILEPVHKLIHAKQQDTIKQYKERLKLTEYQIEKINIYRNLLKLENI